MDEHASADEPIRVFPLDWDPIDAGFVMLSNYFKRFWWPLLDHPAAPLYELLLSFTGPQNARCWPSIQSLADTLGVDRRALTGRTLKGKAYPGAIERLQHAGLVTVEIDPDGRLIFWPRQRPPLLTEEQAGQLPPTVRSAHARWIAANTNPLPNQNVRSMVGTTPKRRKQNTRSMVRTTPPLVRTTPPLVRTTRTIRSNKTQQQNDIDASQKADHAEHAPERPDPHARVGWAAIAADLDRYLTRYQRQTLHQLTPLSDRNRTLILRTNQTYVAAQWRAGDTAERIRRLWPYPLDTVAILGPGEVHPSIDGEEDPQ